MTLSDPTPPAATGGGNTAKWVALGCGGCFSLTLLIGLGLALVVNRTLRFAVGPNQGEGGSQELFTYTLPGESKSIFNLGLFGMQVIQVASADTPPSVLLTMGQLPAYIQGREAQKTFVEEFQNSVTVEGDYRLTEQRVEERTLCEQSVAVLVQSGQFEDGPTTYDAASLLTVVEYNNNARFVWVLTQGDRPEAIADQVFATLDCR